MKKLLFGATMVCAAFTGCVNDNESVLSTEENPQPITFEVAKYKPSSRAEVAFPTNVNFGAYAYVATGTTGHTIFMDNVMIKYFTAETPYWSSEGIQYFWPDASEGKHLDFICYAPYNADPTSPAVPKIDNSDEQKTMVFSNFTVDASNPVDLMFADKAVRQTTNTSKYGFTGVPTLFHHALAKLNIRVRMLNADNSAVSPGHVTSWSVVVNSIEISNIFTTGTLTLKNAEDHSSATTSPWTRVRAIDSYNVWNINDERTVINKKWTYSQTLSTTASIYGGSYTDRPQNYFVIPQALYDDANGQSLTIDYTVTTTNPDNSVVTKNEIKTVKFKSYPSVQAWEMGKNITYTIEIDPAGDVIHFAPAVVDWEDVYGTISI